MTTDQKGAIAETAIALAAIKLGIGVFRPIGDERYDLIFDLRPKLCRVQCKWPRATAMSSWFEAVQVAGRERA
jgi:hypothetical protein